MSPNANAVSAMSASTHDDHHAPRSADRHLISTARSQRSGG
ncbi:hypothetical protein [Streptomyces virginiae]|nr:hypothetical protein [Streptomyces virginiae]